MKNLFKKAAISLLALLLCIMPCMVSCNTSNDSDDDGGYLPEEGGYDDNGEGNGDGSPEEVPDEYTFDAENLRFSLNDDNESYTLTKYNGWAREIIIPDTYEGKPVTIIGEYACYQMSVLEKVILPNQLVAIGKDAFSECTSLTSVVFPESVEYIGFEAFAECSSLHSVTIYKMPDISDGAFFHCLTLVEVIDKSQANLKDMIGSFKHGNIVQYARIVHNGESMIKREGIYDFITLDGVNYMLGVDLPDDHGNEITLPEKYNGENYQIYHDAFRRQQGLKSVVIPDGVSAEGADFFNYCSLLEKVVFPEGLTAIGDYAFEGCTSLKSVYIPKTVTSIGEKALGYSAVLSTIEFGGTKSEWANVAKGKNYMGSLENITVKCSDGNA